MRELVIDVSSNNSEPQWKKVAAWRKGTLLRWRVRGVYIKATEGTSYVFRDGLAWAKSARSAGLNVGRYHFAQPKPGNAKLESAHFARSIGTVKQSDFRPVLDLETNKSGMSWGQLEEWAREFNQEFFHRTGILPGFYSSSYWAANIGRTKPVGAFLWDANWSSSGVPFKAPVPGSWKHVSLHQFTSEASSRSPYHPDGVSGRIDISQILQLRPLMAYPDTLDV